MINYGKFLFAAPPRTGTTYFLKAAYLAGYGEGFKAHVHDPFPEDHTGTILRLSLVRHPVDWLRSYYTAIYPGSVGVDEVDALLTLPGGDFEEFAFCYVERMGNHFEHLYGAYKSNTNLRIEDAPWAMIETFESFAKLDNEQVQLILGLGKQNISKELPHVPNHLRRLIEDVEEYTMERYDY